MSLTEAFLTESGGMRGLEAGSNRVREDHSGPAPVGWETLQAKANGAFGGSLQMTWDNNLTADSVQVVQFQSNQNNLPTSFSDTAGHVWHLIANAPHPGHGSMYVYSATTKAAAVGTKPTVTIDYGGYTFGAMAEFSGVTEPTGIASASAALTNSNAMAVGPTGSATGDGFLALGHLAIIGGSNVTGYSGDLVAAWTSPFWSVMVSDTVDTGATFSATATMSGLDDWVACATVWPLAVVVPSGPFVETFTGTNGAAWDSAKWEDVAVVGTGLVDIQSNAGRMQVGGGAYYGARARAIMPDTADVNVLVKFTFATTDEMYPCVGVRTGTAWNGDGEFAHIFNGYEVEFGATGDGKMYLFNYVGGVRTSLASPSISGATTAPQWLRVEAVGTTIRVKHWLNSVAEPSTWQIEVTNSAHTTGRCTLAALDGNTSVNRTVTWDDYSINAVPWSPADLPLVGWWDTSNLAEVAFHSGSPTGPVSQVNDLSGNGRHLVQATEANAPSRNLTINGLQAVQVVSQSDWLHTSFGSAFSQPLTIAVVGRFSTSSGPQMYDNSPGQPSFGIWHDSAGTVYQSTEGDVFGSHTAGPAALFLSTYNGASSSLRINGVTVGTGDNVTTTLSGLTVLINRENNASRNSTGFGEFIVCSGVLSTIDRDALESYLAAKWGLPLWTPDDISGLVLWYDPSDAATVTMSGANVTAITGRAGYGASLATETGNVTKGSQNGLDTLLFAAGNSGMNGALAATWTSSQLSCFCVHNFDNSVTWARAVALQTSDSADDYNNAASMVVLGKENHMPAAFYNNALTNAPSTYAGAWNIGSTVTTATTVTLGINGTTVATGSKGDTAMSAERFGFGGRGITPETNDAWRGHLAETLVYNRTLTAPEQTQVRDYLKAKWGTP